MFKERSNFWRNVVAGVLAGVILGLLGLLASILLGERDDAVVARVVAWAALGLNLAMAFGVVLASTSDTEASLAWRVQRICRRLLYVALLGALCGLIFLALNGFLQQSLSGQAWQVFCWINIGVALATWFLGWFWKESTPKTDPGKLVSWIRQFATGAISLQGSRLAFEYRDMKLEVLYDIAANRMRIMCKLAQGVRASDIAEDALRTQHRHLRDLRLSLDDDDLFAIYLHPLDSLTQSQFASALEQFSDLNISDQDRWRFVG